MAKILSFANHKGGVAKTTSTASVGAILASMGYKVLMIDLDAQENLTCSFIQDDEKKDLDRTIYDALIEKKNLPVYEIKENLFIVPSHYRMSKIEMQMSSFVSKESILKKLLAPIKDLYDFILIDCPPSLGFVTYNALVASTHLFVPMLAETLPTIGLTMLEESLSEIEDLNPGIAISGIFFTRWEGKNINKVLEDSIRASYGDKVLTTRIRVNVALTNSQLFRQDILEFDSKSNGAIDYSNLTKEILSIVSK